VPLVGPRVLLRGQTESKPRRDLGQKLAAQG